MYSFRRFTLILPLAAVISFLSVSCSETKVAQCQKIVTIANGVVKETSQVTERGQKKDPNAYIKGAEAMEKAAKEMEAANVKDEKLKDYQTGFISLYRDTSKATRAVVNAYNKKDRPAYEAAVKNLQKAMSPEKDLVGGINSYCNGS